MLLMHGKKKPRKEEAEKRRSQKKNDATRFAHFLVLGKEIDGATIESESRCLTRVLEGPSPQQREKYRQGEGSRRRRQYPGEWQGMRKPRSFRGDGWIAAEPEDYGGFVFDGKWPATDEEQISARSLCGSGCSR
jgi:hypothetical protein